MQSVNVFDLWCDRKGKGRSVGLTGLEGDLKGQENVKLCVGVDGW